MAFGYVVQASDTVKMDNDGFKNIRNFQPTELLNTRNLSVASTYNNIVASTYNNMANVHQQLGNLDESLNLYQKSLDIKIQCHGNEHASVADTKYNIACLYRMQGDNIQAKKLFQEAAAVYRTVYGANHTETVDALNQARK